MQNYHGGFTVINNKYMLFNASYDMYNKQSINIVITINSDKWRAKQYQYQHVIILSKQQNNPITSHISTCYKAQHTL